MNRTCRNCGAPIPAGASVFCHRCGAQLPPEIPVCRKCGKKQADLQSRFCDRCGTSLIAPAQPLPSAAPASHTKACPRCGFENNGTALFYCKKCGTGLEKPQAPGTEREEVTREMPARIGAVRRNGLPQTPAARPREPQPEAPAQYRAAQPGSPRKYRKIAIGVVVVVLIIAAIAAAFIFMKPSGTPGAGSDNSTTPGLLGSLSKILPEKTPAATGASPKTTPKKGVAGNQGTAVFSDTPPA